MLFRSKLRFRTDWRGVGLDKAIRLASWTFIFVLISQLGFLATVNLATRAGIAAEAAGINYGVGYTFYATSIIYRKDKIDVTSWADLVGFVEIDLMVSDDGKPVLKKEGSEVRRTITVTPRSGLVAKSRIPALSGILSVDSFVTKVNEIFSNNKKEGK